MINDSARRVSILRNTARIILFIITSFWFIFALLSGAEQYGGGIKGIIINSPNALPWLLLYLINLLSWKYELLGGIILMSCALFMTFAFDALEANWGVLWIAVVPLFLLGCIFVYCAYKPEQKSQAD